MCVCLIPSAAWAANHAGLAAEWNFDEAKGNVLRDTSGNKNHGKIHGAERVKLRKGHALKFDGKDDYVDCGAGPSLDIRGPITLEAWIHPLATPDSFREPGIAGKHHSSYSLTYYHSNSVWWYIGSGTNQCPSVISEDREKVQAWHHVVGTFDGAGLVLYVDGRPVRRCQSAFKSVPSGKNFLIGCTVFDPTATDPADASHPHFRGMIDAVRVYSRALSPSEILARYKREAADYGIDTSWFDQLKVTLYPYFDRDDLVVELDYRGMFHIGDDARIVVEMIQAAAKTQVGRKKEISRLPKHGKAEVTLSLADLAPGEYEVRAAFVEEKGSQSVAERRFRFPAPPVPIVSPEEKVAVVLAPAAQPAPYGFELCEGGGFKIRAGGGVYPFESWYSYPYGEYNRLTASPQPWQEAEKSWKVRTREIGRGEFSVTAIGKYYTIQRHLQAQPTRVYVKDTIRNTSGQDLGILIYNRLAGSKDQEFEQHYTAGFKEMGRKEGTASPTVFAGKKGVGIGIVLLDDVFIVQSVLHTEPDFLSVGTEKFGLPKDASYTLEWAVYPIGSDDYFDFINAVRKDEDRNGGTIAGGFAFISKGPFNRRNIPTGKFLQLRNTKYGCIHCLSGAADDPQVSIEGIEFMDFPKEMGLLKKQLAAIHKEHPDLKVMFHVAHSLYATNKPDRFADSKVIQADGTQAVWGDPNGNYISKKRQAEGWRWYIFYPTPGNRFHDALMKSVDKMMDEIGCDGVFMDGFMWGYCGRYTYDRWDGHSVEIDKKTKTIKRKIASVLLLSQPSLVQFSRKVRDKGGVVVANNAVITRTIAREKYIIHDMESGVGPHLHLASTVAGLTGPRKIRSESDAYKSVLDKLVWGTTHFYYSEGDITYPSLPAQMFPITFEEIHAGYIKGRERLITMRSGVYGWPGDRALHLAHHYDGRGVLVPHSFLTTVDPSGVRTDLALKENESAVLKKIPITIETLNPVNVLVQQYDAKGITLLLNGKGKALLQIRNGDFEIRPGAAYRVKPQPLDQVTAGKNGILSLPLTLDGQMSVTVQAAE